MNETSWTTNAWRCGSVHAWTCANLRVAARQINNTFSWCQYLLYFILNEEEWCSAAIKIYACREKNADVFSPGADQFNCGLRVVTQFWKTWQTLLSLYWSRRAINIPPKMHSSEAIHSLGIIWRQIVWTTHPVPWDVDNNASWFTIERIVRRLTNSSHDVSSSLRSPHILPRTLVKLNRTKALLFWCAFFSFISRL